MTFVQPSSNDYATSGFNFFRLTAPLASPGDIYQSTQGSHGLVIGPDSDIAKVQVAYYDPNVANNIAYSAISPTRGFFGAIYSQEDQVYIPANRPGKILFWSDDLYNPSYKPVGFSNPNNDVLTSVTPVLDVIEYFQPLGSVAPQRNDKEYLFSESPQITDGVATAWYIIPCFGRRSVQVMVFNLSGVSVNLDVRGLKYFINNFRSALEIPIVTAAVVNSVIPTNHNLTVINAASTGGRYDAVIVGIKNSAGAGGNGIVPIYVQVSDENSPSP